MKTKHLWVGSLWVRLIERAGERQINYWFVLLENRSDIMGGNHWRALVGEQGPCALPPRIENSFIFPIPDNSYMRVD